MGAKAFLTAAAIATGFATLSAGTAVAGDDKAKLGTKDDPGRRVCRSILPTGSRFTTRVCKTAAEWDKEAEEAGEGGRKMQTGPGHRLGPINPGGV